MVLAREKTLSKIEVKEILNNINQKKVIKTTSIGVLGLGAFKFIANYSNVVDNFIFSNSKEFLLNSNLSFLSIAIPNWFSLILLLGFVVSMSVDIYSKIIKKSR
jgi:hypothetical protein